MIHKIVVVEVPTEAGTHFAGQTLAPRAVQKAGLQEKLKHSGYEVETVNALPDGPVAWKPTSVINGVRNEAETVTVMNNVYDTVSQTMTQRGPKTLPIPLVIGGDCSIVPAVMASLSHSFDGKRLGIIYMDGDADLRLPKETSDPSATAILDSMTLTHLTRREGALASMKKFSSSDSSPLVKNDNIVLFGLDPLQPAPSHFAYLLDHHFRVLTRPAVCADPLARATEALRWLEERVDAIFLHFDVDVIDSGEFPLGNYPHYAGVRVEDALIALKHFISSRKLVGMTVTEINPNNDPDGKMVGQIVNSIASAFEERLKGHNM